MKQDAIISIRGAQHPEGGENDIIELETEGQYDFSAEAIHFDYEESELTGLTGTHTSFEIAGNMVTLTRSGTVNSNMVFQEGRKHYFAYETPFGAMTMGVDTHSILSTLGKNGGKLEIHYAIDIENARVSKNVFKINIKTAQRMCING